MTESSEPDQSGENSGSKSIWILIAGVLAVLVCMAWFVTYDWPSGRRPDIGDFVLFWFRELLVLGLLLMALCIWVVRKAIRLGQENSKK
jgi:hypothetical protein